MKNFNLKKFKQDTSGKWIIHFTGIGDDGKNENHDLTFDRIPHADLTSALKELEPLLAKSNDLYPHRKDLGLKVADIENLVAAEIALAKVDEVIRQSVHVSGFYLKGSDESLSVVITGKHNVHHTALAMNSPLIKLGGDAFGFEPEVEEVVNKLIVEIKAYLFDCKSSNVPMDFGDDNTEEVPAETAEEVPAEA